jgi:hypothetical protein
MPRVKRWYPVSQDLLDDPEVIKLRRECGDRAVFMWLRMLSWSDRNDGELKGDRTSIAMTFGRDHDPIHPRSNVDWGLKCLRLMEDQGWITVESSRVLIRNHAKYHNTRDANKTLLGIQTTSPPNLSEPNHPNKKPDGPVDKSKPETETPDPWAPVWQRAGVLVKDGWPHAAGFVGRAKKDGYGPADVLQAFDSVQRKRKEQPDVEVWSYAWGSLKRIYPERNQREGERYKKDDPVHIKQILTAVGKK